MENNSLITLRSIPGVTYVISNAIGNDRISPLQFLFTPNQLIGLG